MKIKKALLDTGFVTEEWIRNENKEWQLTQEDIERMLKMHNLLNGQVAILKTKTFGLYEEYYPIYGLENEEVFKEFVWLLEQDPVFGTYIDDRESFDKDWDNDEYDPAGVMTIPKEFIKEWIEE